MTVWDGTMVHGRVEGLLGCISDVDKQILVW